MPDGMSAIDATSMAPSIPNLSSTSRMIGCFSCFAPVTSSVIEYFAVILSSSKYRCDEMYMYLSIVVLSTAAGDCV